MAGRRIIATGHRRGFHRHGAVRHHITAIAYRRRERWAWFTLWYYPVFWTVHLVAGLPPGQDHVHQIVLIVLSLIGLLVPIQEFFP